MKYWLFDGKDAQGPFEPEQLKALPGFGPQSLICPDGAETADQWRPSQFYLIKPPPAKAETARPSPSRGPASVSKGMGRIADAGLVDEEPAAPAPQAKREPLPEKRRFSSAALLTSAIAAAAAAGGYLYLNQQKLRPKPAPQPAAQAPAPAPPPAVAAIPALTDAQIHDATAFVQDFKTQSPGRKLPSNPADVFSPSRWKAPQTVGEALTMRSLLPLDAAATAVLEKRGEGMRAGERELRKSRKKWASYAERFLRNVAALSWDIQRSKNCPTQSAATGEPTCFEAAALVRTQRGGPQERHAFVADLTARTLKPLDSNAWLDIDPKGLAAWAASHVTLGEPIDEDALAAQSPVYGIPLEHHKHVARHAPIIPQKEQLPASGGEGERPAPAAGYDEQVLEKALLEPSSQGDGERPAPAAQPAPQAAVPPGLGHPPSAAPQAQAQPSAAPAGTQPSGNQGTKGKSAMDMSVDELKKYLNRDGGSN